MSEQQQAELGKILWAIADELRGAMNADDFRDYMLSFLFLKYLSDNYLEVIKDELADDYPDDGLGVWYEENQDDIEEFEEYIKQKTHYIIKPEFLWDSIVSLATKQDDELLHTLESAFKYIENESFSSAYDGLFSEINLNSEKLGKTYNDKNKKLSKIIIKIDDGISKFPNNRDVLGDAYEYLIGQFAAGGGKKAGEFYTPQEISTILSRIVTLDAQNPQSGTKEKLNSVFDFACGSGSLLLNVKKQLGKYGIGKIYGQEKNITTYNLARMNMLLHGVKDSEFEIFHGDSLTNDWDLLNEMNPAQKITFDAVVANPPFSLKWEPTEEMAKDFRFADYGLAPKSAADFAFLLHGFHYLADDGTMAIILPHGVLFRGGAEAKIRKKLILDGNIDTVIGLPSKLFFSTGIPVCIIVLKKCKKDDDILFINASEHFEKGKKQNYLTGEHIDKIINTYQNRLEENKYSKKVSLEEIIENEYNLNISRYISTAEDEVEIDLEEVHQELEKVEVEILKYKDEHNKYLEELGLDSIL